MTGPGVGPAGAKQTPKKNQPPGAPPEAGERVPTCCLDERGTAQGQITVVAGNCQLLRSYDLAGIHEWVRRAKRNAPPEPFSACLPRRKTPGVMSRRARGGPTASGYGGCREGLGPPQTIHHPTETPWHTFLGKSQRCHILDSIPSATVCEPRMTTHLPKRPCEPSY